MSDPLDLDAIAHRIRDCSTYNFGLRNADRLAKEDAPALIAALKEAQAWLRPDGLPDLAKAMIARAQARPGVVFDDGNLDRTETP